ncbi:unnamed protein product [marine sediment metagenome]|uniref:Uncharacterized protein n=1 Tax=marine sediment metagenome TaxID=412755 RepID=X0X194_9ZZZZ
MPIWDLQPQICWPVGVIVITADLTIRFENKGAATLKIQCDTAFTQAFTALGGGKDSFT